MLSERDRRALLILSIAAPVVIIVFYGGPLLNSLFSGSTEYQQKLKRFETINGKMRNFDRWQEELETKQNDLHVRINSGSANQQIDSFVKALEDQGQRAKVHISNYRQMQVKVKTVSGGKKVASQTLLVDCMASWPGLITFVKDIESMTVPVVIEQITLTKRTSEDKPIITATLQLHVYLFPEASSL